MNNFKSLLTFSLLTLSLLLSTSCKDRNNHSVYESQQRQTMAPSKTADEWIKRLKIDLSQDTNQFHNLSYLYAELPPQDQWPSLIKQTNVLTKNQNDFNKLLSRHIDTRQAELKRLKLKLFVSLLEKPSPQQTDLFKQILKSSNISDYEVKTAIKYLTSFTNDPNETLTWFKTHRPELLTPEGNTHSSYSPNRNPWDEPLAKGQINKGLTLLKQAAYAPPSNNKNRIDELNQLLKLAIVLNKQDLISDTSKRLEKRFLLLASPDGHLGYNSETLTNHLSRTKQWTRIIKFIENLAEAKKQNKHKQRNSIHFTSSNDSLKTVELTAIYHIHGAEKFAAKLESHTPEDYIEFLESNTGDQPSIGLIYVDHLIAKSEKPKALNILKTLLTHNQGTDSYYSKLLEIDLPNAADFIRKVHTYDPYEERPLIWLAEIELRNNNLEKAEKTIKRAIDLDPSDGDHGKHSRMLCYDVLARILQKQGNQEKADFFFKVVQSIRDGEAADDFRYAGLISEATRLYKDALGKFNDAYCLQSRLALTLAKNGKFKEAIPHFEKAFNLMPVSFGPRESHCFGCEGLFDEKRVQEIALPILQAFEKKNPDNPRTPYLLGLVLEEMGKTQEAATAYKKAIELDPTYYNAALKLYKITNKNSDTANELPALQKLLFKIAPYPSKPKYIPNPQNLKSYWESSRNFPPSPFNLTPLTDSKEANKKQYRPSSIIHNFTYFEEKDGVNGWTLDELCRHNKFILWLENL